MPKCRLSRLESYKLNKFQDEDIVDVKPANYTIL